MLAILRRRPFAVTAALAAFGVSALWLQAAGRAYVFERREFSVRVVADDTHVARGKAAGLREVSWKLERGEVQYAWYVPSRNRALILYVHGSPGSRGSLLAEATALAARGYGALLLDLPGYGKSEGERRWGKSFRESVTRAIDFAAAQPDVDPRRIAGFGYSMGSAILAQVAADDVRIRSLVLLAAFTRLEDQLRHQFRSRVPGAAAAAVLAARHAGVPIEALDTQTAVRKLGPRPLLLIAGALDQTIPRSMPELLAHTALQAELFVAPGIGHAGFAERLGGDYFDRVARFFAGSLIEGSVPSSELVHTD